MNVYVGVQLSNQSVTVATGFMWTSEGSPNGIGSVIGQDLATGFNQDSPQRNRKCDSSRL